MPAFSTHYLFAKEMIKLISNETNIQINENAVFLGTQGPDVFFFHRIAPWMIGKSYRKIGSILHRSKMEDILYKMAEYCKSKEVNNTTISYCYGFLLHYALDRNCHPYVYAIQNKMTNKYKNLNPHTAHNTIELSLDSYMLNEKLNITKPEAFNTSNTIIIDKKEVSDISKLLQYILKNALNIKIEAKDIELAFYDTKRAQKYLHDEVGIGTKLLKNAETIVSPIIKGYKISSMLRPKDLEIAKKYANIYNGLWVSPFESTSRNESFMDLFNLSKFDAVNMIKGFNQLINGNKIDFSITNNLSFLTGVEVK